MSNLKQWILKAANGERIEAVIFGELLKKEGITLDTPSSASEPATFNEILTWAEAEKRIDREARRHRPAIKAVTAWTKNRIIFVSQQHGATNIEYAPRRLGTLTKNPEH